MSYQGGTAGKPRPYDWDGVFLFCTDLGGKK